MDIVCFYTDLGFPQYPALLEQLCKSAQEVMPEARRVLLTTTPGCDGAERFQKIVSLPVEIDETNLCFRRAQAITSWMIAAETDTIIVDADIKFLRPVQFGAYDVGLMWRNKADQPVNSGMILGRPGFKEFWRHYGTVAASLPVPFHAWWGDQLPLSLLTGVCRRVGDTVMVDDALVHLIDMYRFCAKVGEPDDQAWAVHYKGPSRKGLHQ